MIAMLQVFVSAFSLSAAPVDTRVEAESCFGLTYEELNRRLDQERNDVLRLGPILDLTYCAIVSDKSAEAIETTLRTLKKNLSMRRYSDQRWAIVLGWILHRRPLALPRLRESLIPAIRSFRCPAEPEREPLIYLQRLASDYQEHSEAQRLLVCIPPLPVPAPEPLSPPGLSAQPGLGAQPEPLESQPGLDAQPEPLESQPAATKAPALGASPHRVTSHGAASIQLHPVAAHQSKSKESASLGLAIVSTGAFAGFSASSVYFLARIRRNGPLQSELNQELLALGINPASASDVCAVVDDGQGSDYQRAGQLCTKLHTEKVLGYSFLASAVVTGILAGVLFHRFSKHRKERLAAPTTTLVPTVRALSGFRDGIEFWLRWNF